MKCAVSAAVICLTASLACGQPHHDDIKIAYADSVKIAQYGQKSILKQSSRPDSSIYFANLGLALSRNLHYRTGEGHMLERFARVNEQYGNLKLATKYQQEALSLFDAVHDTLAATDATASLGILEGKQGNIAAGLRLVTKAVEWGEKGRDTARMIRVYTKLAELYELDRKPSKALEYYAKAEQLNEGMPATDEYLELLGSIGKAHATMGNHDLAAAYYEKGIGKSGAGRHAKAHVAFLNKAGKAWDSAGDKKKAFSYHQLGQQKAQASGLPEEEARSLIGMAVALKGEDADLSINHLKKALAIADSIGNDKLSAEIYQSLSEIYRQQSRYLDALTALEEHHRLLDSLTNENKGHKIAVLQSSYEVAESRLHIETLELANKEKTYQRNLGVLAAAAALIVLAALSYSFTRTRRLNKQLEESNRIKDRLFSILGHDLRGPIGGIAQLLGMMEGQEPGESHKQMISVMKKQGDATLEILNSLLSWGEAQLKGVRVKPIAFNAKDDIKKNIAALDKQAADKSILVVDNTSDGIPLYADADHFDFVIRNLLSNAIKFSPPSGTIEIAADTGAASGQTVFSVRDYGKGISPEQLALFSKSTLDVSYGTSGEKGTGIGLMLAKEFIRANKGRIWVESKVGEGATFFFSLDRGNTSLKQA